MSQRQVTEQRVAVWARQQADKVRHVVEAKKALVRHKMAVEAARQHLLDLSREQGRLEEEYEKALHEAAVEIGLREMKAAENWLVEHQSRPHTPLRVDQALRDGVEVLDDTCMVVLSDAEDPQTPTNDA